MKIKLCVLLIICLMSTMLFGCNKSAAQDTDYNTVVSENQELSNELAQAQTKYADLQTKYNALECSQNSTSSQSADKKDYTLSAGNYIVGKDVTVGMYDITLVSGTGLCSADHLSEMFSNDSRLGIKKFNNAKFSENDTIEITNDLKLKFTSK